MAFTKVGNIKYYDLMQCSQGDLLVEGYYNGIVQGQFGDQYEFKGDDGALTVLSGGHLRWLIDKFVNIGDRCQVYYDGNDIMQKGAFKGKLAHKFELLVDEEDNNAPAQEPQEPQESEDVPWKSEAIALNSMDQDMDMEL